MTRARRIFVNATLAAISVGVALIGGEACLRTYQWLRDGTPFFAKPYALHNAVITLDQERGWRATENLRMQTLMRNSNGESYGVSISQEQHGFRLWGQLNNPHRHRLLVIGDSYTHAREVSDTNTYYWLLARNLEAEVFAYGVAGYGTLQEYQSLAKYFQIIRPDAILWQYCGNDLINNSESLERKSTINNNGMKRPYLVGGRIEYALPKSYTRIIREFALHHSRFLLFIITRLDRLRGAATRESKTEMEIRRRGVAFPEFAQVIEVTDEIMGKVRQLIGNVPVLAFDSDGFGDSIFAAISKRHGIHYLSGVSDSLQAAERQGVVTTAEDKAHWSPAGHALVARVLFRSIRELDLGRLSRSRDSLTVPRRN